MANTIITVDHLFKSFQVGKQDVPILKDVTFRVDSGDFCIIFGPSGCGKSTLLHTILGLEAPTKGICLFLSQDFYNDMNEDQRSEFRKNHIGMVYQQPNWIKSLSVMENVAFPLILLGKSRVEAYEKAKTMLTLMDMSDWASYIPMDLSSGQQQKIALARALITDPEVVIADEPTGNLDFESGQELMQILVKLNKEQKKTILMVTHDLEYLKFAKTVIRMFDGTIDKEFGEKNKAKFLTEVKVKKRKRI